MRKLILTVIAVVMLIMLGGCAEQGYAIDIEPYCCDQPTVEGLAMTTQTPFFQRSTAIDIDIDEDAPEPIRIGVTRPSHDNVGQILNFFGSGVGFYVLSDDDLGDLERLREFYAIFINCGSHNYVVPRVLRSYVEQGGVVYASDLAASRLTSAFSGMFEYETVDPSLTVRDANIPHPSLASHMGIDYLDVEFNMGGWRVITELSEDATVYIEGRVPGHGTVPLAISFGYGEGTVFFTSFHNNAQATSYMIDFIEYLVFRIKFIEADRNLSLRAEADGFEYQGAVFGFFARQSTAAMEMGVAAAPFIGDAAAEADDMEWSSGVAQESIQEFFQFTFSEGEDFMLMVEAGGVGFTQRLYDPLGNVFVMNQHGELLSYELTAGSELPSFEEKEGYGVLVRNATGGQWGFTLTADDASADATFAVGIATQAP